MIFKLDDLLICSSRVNRKKALAAQLRELQEQQKYLEPRVKELLGKMIDEQKDVKRLEGRSLSSFFYNVVGKMDEQLTKEREEAYAARVKYDSARAELSAVEDDIRRCTEELSTLEGCEEKYEEALKERAEAIKASGIPAADELLRLQERQTTLFAQIRELNEAISAGTSALNSAVSALELLDDAKGWGTFDLWGGGLIVDMVKHDYLDKAQTAVEELQAYLRRFKTELADVSIHSDFDQINVEGFLRFADFFFDNLFTDWEVQDGIKQSLSQVQSTKEEIEDALARLSTALHSADGASSEVKSQIDELLLNTEI